MVIVLLEDVNDYKVVYDTETKEVTSLSENEIQLLRHFSIRIGENYVGGYFTYPVKDSLYTLHNGEITKGVRMSLAYCNSHNIPYEGKTTGDKMYDILFSIEGVSDPKKIDKVVKKCFTSAAFAGVDKKGAWEKLHLALPEGVTLTKRELQDYESYFATYIGVDNIRTRILCSVPRKNCSGEPLGREFKEGTYTIEGSKVVFSDSVETTLGEFLSCIDKESYPQYNSYFTAAVLTNEMVDIPTVRLQKRVCFTESPALDYTLLYEETYIKVKQRETKYRYFTKVQEGVSGVTLLDKTTMTLKQITSMEAAQLPMVQRAGSHRLDSLWNYNKVNGEEIFSENLVCIALHQIEVTEKGYDIRILAQYAPYGEKQGPFYSIPLLITGIIAEKVNESYVLELALQTITLSKTVYENLICVGNGTEVCRGKI